MSTEQDDTFGLSRRDLLKLSAFGAVQFMLPPFVRGQSPTTAPELAATTRPDGKATARAVIQIWLWGGPPHLDMWDPKPEAGPNFCGPFDKPVETNVEGIRICQQLPLLAKLADKFSLIRTMTHGNNGHETAAYMVQTGRPPGGRFVYPGVGAVVTLLKAYGAGYKSQIPPYIVLTEPQGRFAEAGFLGNRYGPFATGGDPAAGTFRVEGIVSAGITEARAAARTTLRDQLNTFEHEVLDNPQIAALRRAEKEAADLVAETGRLFDLSQEARELRDKYGRNKFGQSCLMARRLVEAGVPYVTINYGGWDTHSRHFQTMLRKLPELDRGMASLLEDLSERNLLDSTIIWCGGEFGRTPRIDWQPPWDGGRGHYGRVFSTFIAGGGFKGGRVVGSTTDTGEEVKDRPVYPADLIASMYELLGIDPAGKLPHPQGFDVAAIPTKEEGVPMAGKLKEIM